MKSKKESEIYMKKISVAKYAKGMDLKELTPEINANEIFLSDPDVNRPALQLAGFYDYFRSERPQLIGNVEGAYLNSLEDNVRHEKLERMFQTKIPCMIYCRSRKPYPDTIELAKKMGVPLFGTDCGTSEMAQKSIRFLNKYLSETITIHGVLIDVFGEGVLITGESGIGKSEAALELIKRGHRLVSDDAVVIRKASDDMLVGTAPDITRDFIELRGVGVIDVKSLFGLESVKPEQKIDFEIHIEEWDKDKEYDRLGNADETAEYLGKKITRYTIPLRPGRNLAVIVEAVAINYRQRTLGYNAVEELYRRVQNNLGKEND